MVKKILCIDRNVADVQDCINELKSLEPEVTTDFSPTVMEGRRLFKEEYYGLIIIDLSLMNKDILDFIEEIRRGNFYGDIIFTGNYKDEEIMKRIGLLKDIEVLLKPFDIQWFISGIKKYFNENISIGNRISSIGPCFFMRLMNIGDCTAVCKVIKEEKQGFIHFENGQIVNAKSWRNSGELALIDMLELTDAKIEIMNDEKIGPQKINMDFNSLISIVSSQTSVGCVEKNTESGPDDSAFIDHVIKTVDSIKGLNGSDVVEKSVGSMGHSLTGFPGDAEVDLIERISGEIKDKSALIKFKKSMMLYLKDREIGKIRKEGR